MKYLFILLLFSIFIVACSDNTGTGNESCDNKCSIEKEKTCTDNSVMICKKDKNGCFFLETLEDCTDSKVCVNHECKEESTKEIKKKIIVGAGTKSSSASFKLKLNVGKITTIKKLKSTNFKLKIGTSTIDKK